MPRFRPLPNGCPLGTPPSRAPLATLQSVATTMDACCTPPAKGMIHYCPLDVIHIIQWIIRSSRINSWSTEGTVCLTAVTAQVKLNLLQSNSQVSHSSMQARPGCHAPRKLLLHKAALGCELLGEALQLLGQPGLVAAREIQRPRQRLSVSSPHLSLQECLN